MRMYVIAFVGMLMVGFGLTELACAEQAPVRQGQSQKQCEVCAILSQMRRIVNCRETVCTFASPGIIFMDGPEVWVSTASYEKLCEEFDEKFNILKEQIKTELIDKSVLASDESLIKETWRCILWGMFDRAKEYCGGDLVSSQFLRDKCFEANIFSIRELQDLYSSFSKGLQSNCFVLISAMNKDWNSITSAINIISEHKRYLEHQEQCDCCRVLGYEKVAFISSFSCVLFKRLFAQRFAERSAKQETIETIQCICAQLEKMQMTNNDSR